MKIVTSVTVWNDAVGVRMSITYSEVDPDTGKVISDNKRIDRVVTSETAKADINSLMDYARSFLEDE